MSDVKPLFFNGILVTVAHSIAQKRTKGRRKLRIRRFEVRIFTGALFFRLHTEDAKVAKAILF